MFRKLTPYLSTAHALILSAIELPDALHYVVEFARENGATEEEVAFWRAARNRWIDWACHVEGGQATPGVELSHDSDTDMMARITVALRENSELRKKLELSEQNRLGQLDIAKERHGRVKALSFELSALQARLTETEKALRLLLNDRDGIERDRDALTAQINSARDQLSALSSWLGFGLGGENESLMSMVQRVKEGVENHVVVQNNMTNLIVKGRDKLDIASRNLALIIKDTEDERDTLRAKLDDLERWRHVTSGEGELPPEGVDVIYRYDDRPRLFLGKPSNNRTYQWRFASSGEASNG